jgi:putative FmdB family regulatory protein
MPIYEYHCEGCNKDFESLVFGNETPGCPFCNSTNVRKLMSACGFVSKGTVVGSNGKTETVKTSASASPCSGCSAGSCAGCGSA